MNLVKHSADKFDEKMSANHRDVMKVANLWGINIAILESERFFSQR